ncbi:hypothetical protein N566_11615 [Streptomycetaceae bacterium MP113-05]|nr:hypothetical protein N566_11615 [Streptomycetaceae bacterium MP113-05]
MSASAVPLSVLDVRPSVLDFVEYPGHVAYVTLLVDGRDLLEDLGAEGYGSMADEWTSPLRPTPLEAGPKPRRVYLSAADCGLGCCGGVSVTLRREGSEVVWSEWLNTYAGGAAVPGEIRFDAAQYDAARARMAADHSWERPAETVARLLEESFCDSGFFGHHDTTLVGVWTSRDLPDRVRLRYRSSERRSNSYSGAVVLPLDPGAPPAQEVRRLAVRMGERDPRRLAEDQAGKGHWEL